MKTRWGCEWCGETGVVEHDKNEDVLSVFRRVRDSHKQISDWCEFDVDAVRVRIMEILNNG